MIQLPVFDLPMQIFPPSPGLISLKVFTGSHPHVIEHICFSLVVLLPAFRCILSFPWDHIAVKAQEDTFKISH